MKSILICLFVALIFAIVNAQIPCDDAYGAHCPEAAGLEVGECLKKLDQSTLSKECSDYIRLHDTCREDLEKHCTGKEYTGDALVCLNEWTKPDDLSTECKEALPKKVVKEKKLSDAEKKKAAKRRQSRKAAAKMAREF